MIGAQDIDQLLEAAFTLVQVIRDIGSEVGPLAILALDHAILLVAVVGRLEPQRAVLRYTCPLALRRSSARSMAPLSARLRSENHSSNVTPNSARSSRMSPRISFERQVENTAQLGCTEQRARAFDQRIDVQVLVACRRVGRQVADTSAASRCRRRCSASRSLRAIGRMYSPR